MQNGADRKKSQHFVPRLYLEGFCDERNMIWTYHKNDKEKQPYPQKPDNVAIENYFYSLEGKHVDANAFENALADLIESPAVAPLRKVIQGEAPSFDDRQRLSLLFGFMLVRTPSYRIHSDAQQNRNFNLDFQARARNKEEFEKWMDGYLKTFGEPLTDNLEEFRREILAGEYQFKLTTNYSLHIIQILGSAVSMLLASMKWTIIKAPIGMNFLTSDNPVIIEDLQGNNCRAPGLGIIGTRVFIPASKDIGVLMVRDTGANFDVEVVDGDEALLTSMNNGFISRANKYVYACQNDEDIRKQVQGK